MNSKTYECCILGAGPAGIGVALELVKHGVTDILIIEKSKKFGGLSRTENFDGIRFDIGPHRFFTKNKEISELWNDTLGEDFKLVNRLTRIHHRGKYFNYPIRAFDALAKLGPTYALHVLISFAASKIAQHNKPITFEDWITRKFGRKLYETFFKNYTEKVCGIPCNHVDAEWAAQRIDSLDIIQVLKQSLLGGKSDKIRTSIKQFNYPLLGAGQMYEVMSDKVISHGVEILLDSKVVSFSHSNNLIKSIDVLKSDEERLKITAKQFFSSIPITHFFKMLEPQESDEYQQATEALYYRDHITVNLLVHGADLFRDQWIYIHSPDVQMSRVVNYNNFSKAMVGKKNKTALSVEYFVFQNEGLWRKSNESLKALAIDELDFLGLVKKRAVERSWVVRETEAYPMYYLGYKKSYNILKSRIAQFANLNQMGRAGLYKYNNQDHSIMNGILSARNYVKP